MVEERFVLIDTDAGIDDATAILMSIQAHKRKDFPFHIVGITCLSGNAKVDDVTRNVTRTLQLVGENEIPIFRGASEPMVLPFECKFKFHGNDGFGDVASFPKIQPKVEAEHAVNAIVRLTQEYAGRLTILALGPLTNLALAVRMDPSIKNQLKDIYLMGGNVEGAGNDTICAEFNFAYDPEAAHVCLSTYECPIFVVPLEIGRDKVIQPYAWREIELGIQTIDTKESRFINMIEAYNMEHRHKVLGKWTSYDSTAAVALIAPKSITKLLNHHCLVELQGQHTRGQLIVDFKSHLKTPENIFIVTDMNVNVYKDMLKWAFGGACPL